MGKGCEGRGTGEHGKAKIEAGERKRHIQQRSLLQLHFVGGHGVSTREPMQHLA